MIDKDEAIRLLRKEVANKGEDYVYRSPLGDSDLTCVYFYEDQPSCLVGHAISHDESLSAIVKQDEFNSISAMSLPGCDMEALAVFNEAQILQDRGNTWGIALSAAENKYCELGGTE